MAKDDPLTEFMKKRLDYERRVAEAAKKAAEQVRKAFPGIYNADGTRKTPKRCEATTRKGTGCKRKPVPGTVYCRQHRNYEDDDGFSTYRGW